MSDALGEGPGNPSSQPGPPNGAAPPQLSNLISNLTNLTLNNLFLLFYFICKTVIKNKFFKSPFLK